MCALVPGNFSPSLLCACGPLDMGAEPILGVVSLGVEATMWTWKQLLALGLGVSLTQALQILF